MKISSQIEINEISLSERNPYIMRGLPDSSNPVVFGARPPERESYEDICGPPQTCPECVDPKWAFEIGDYDDYED